MTGTPSWGISPEEERPGGERANRQDTPTSTDGAWQSAGELSAWQPVTYGPAPTPVPPRGRGRRGRAWLAVASAVVLIAVGTSTSVVLAGTGTAATSPAAAVHDLVGALNKSDVIGMLDAVDPGERNALEPGLEGIFDQLKRLGILSPTADLNAIDGVDVSEHGLKTSTEQLSSDVAAVTVSGGSNTESLDPSRIPLGRYFRDLAGKAMSGRSVSTTGPNNGSATFGTVRVDGGWYVSLGYSIAINAMQNSGQNGAPPASGQVHPAGASSPEGAVQGLFNEVSRLDLTALMGDLDPEEMAAADAYAADWLPRAQMALDKVGGQVSIQFGNLNLSTARVDGGTLVKVGAGLTLTLREEGMEIHYANGCYTYTYTVGGSSSRQCVQRGDQQLTQLKRLLPAPVQPILTRLATMKPDLGFVVVNEGGKWYVSPTRTYLEAISAFLSELRPGDIQTVINNASGIGSAFERYLQQEMGQAPPGGTPSVGWLGSLI